MRSGIPLHASSRSGGGGGDGDGTGCAAVVCVCLSHHNEWCIILFGLTEIETLHSTPLHSTALSLA